MRKIDSILQERLVTLIAAMGYEWVGCESVLIGRRITLRIYIDQSNGVTSDDCSRVSRQVSAMMDVENHLQNSYVLEVSSPGIDRPLFELGQYKQFIGSKIKLLLYVPHNGRRKFQGLLKRVEGEDIYLWVDDTQQELMLPFSTIEKANIIGDIRI